MLSTAIPLQTCMTMTSTQIPQDSKFCTRNRPPRRCPGTYLKDGNLPNPSKASFLEGGKSPIESARNSFPFFIARHQGRGLGISNNQADVHNPKQIEDLPNGRES